MASVRLWKIVTDNFAAKVLSLVIAALFWLTVTVGKETTRSYSLPVRLVNMPRGLAVGGNPPGSMDVTVTGPAVLFLAHPAHGMQVVLDLRNTGKGTVVFPDMHRYVRLPDGISVLRVFPSSIELELVEK